MIDLSIIIVNWNTDNLLENCINSIIENTRDLVYEIIVFDNNSVDDSAKREFIKYKNVNVIYSKENLGFSKGNNLAYKEAEGKYILLLNPDTYVKSNSINNAYNYIINSKEKDVLLGAKLLNKDGTIQLSSCKFPTVKNMILRNYINSKEMHKITHETEWVMGAFMMLKSDLYERVGKLDERFFMYSEDLDLCYQVKKNGGKIIHFSDAEIIHFYNQSGAKKWSGKREKIIKDSMKKFINKNYIGINKILCKIIVDVRYIIKSICRKK